MSEPVIASDGHVYEKVCLEEWFSTGARTSPVTNAPLEDTRVLPCHPIKSMIAEFLAETRAAAG